MERQAKKRTILAHKGTVSKLQVGSSVLKKVVEATNILMLKKKASQGSKTQLETNESMQSKNSAEDQSVAPSNHIF